MDELLTEIHLMSATILYLYQLPVKLVNLDYKYLPLMDQRILQLQTL